jgi:hypothetical protein
MVGIFLMMLVFVWFFIFPTWHHEYTTRARTSSQFSRFAVPMPSRLTLLAIFYPWISFIFFLKYISYPIY